MSGATSIHVERMLDKRQRYLQSMRNVDHKLSVAKGEAPNKAGMVGADPAGEVGARAELQRLHAEMTSLDDDLKTAHAMIATLNF